MNTRCLSQANSPSLPFIACALLLTLSLPVWAHTGKGWQWYDDPTPTVTEPDTPKVNTVHTPIPQQSQPPSDEALSYSEQLKAWQAEFQEAKAAAVMAPSPEHLYRLQSLIEASWDKTHQLADAWQQTLLLHPELDYNATHPTGERAKRAFFEQKDQQVEATLAKLAREGAGLFWCSNLGMSTCMNSPAKSASLRRVNIYPC